jgi:signal peptidase I
MSNVRVIHGVRRQNALRDLPVLNVPVEDNTRRRAMWPAVLSAVAALMMLILHFVLGLGMATVLSASMRPAFAPGDAVITQQRDVRSLHPGEVLLYHPPGETATLAHRIVSLTWHGARATVVTKGDANPTAEAPVSIGRSGGPVVVATVPHLGSALTWVNPERPTARAALVGLIGLLLTLGAVRRAVRTSACCKCRRCSTARPDLLRSGAVHHVR